MRHTIATGFAMLAIGILWLWRGPELPSAAMAAGARPNPPEPPGHRSPSALGRRTIVAAPAPPDFDALLQQLVGLAVRGYEEVARDSLQQAKVTDAEALALFQQILAAVTDVDDRALWALTALGAGDELSTRVTRQLLGRFATVALQRRQQAAVNGAPAGLITYVDALLGLLVPHQANAELVATLLTDQPYLGAAHEDALLGLTELGAQHPYLHDVARRLLLTLWANLQASGARSRRDLETLAMLGKADRNPTRRAAALETLLVAEDPRLVEFVLADVAESNDQAGAAALAQVAARQLPPERALQVLRRLAHVGDQSMTGPALILGGRDAGAVRRCYEQLLGEAREPKLRGDLITGVGFNPSPDNFDLVLTALELDPDAEVRQRALLALAGAGSAAHGEAAVQAALADPTFTSHPAGLDVIVTAVDNLAQGGEVNAVDRLARQTLCRSDVSESTRSRLRTLLAKALPTGMR